MIDPKARKQKCQLAPGGLQRFNAFKDLEEILWYPGLGFLGVPVSKNCTATVRQEY